MKLPKVGDPLVEKGKSLLGPSREPHEQESRSVRRREGGHVNMVFLEEGPRLTQSEGITCGEMGTERQNIDEGMLKAKAFEQDCERAGPGGGRVL